MTKLSTSRHEIAKLRPELRVPTSPRTAPAGVTSMAVKINPYESMISEALAAAREGIAAAEEGQRFVDEQISRRSK
jgi:hypothetical protein